MKRGALHAGRALTLGLALAGGDASAQAPNTAAVRAPADMTCSAVARLGKAGWTLKDAGDTAWIDHYHLRPGCGRPLIVAVKEGSHFQVVIGNTDTTQFTYTVSAVLDQDLPVSPSGATGAGVPPVTWGDTILTMQHVSKNFDRYRVTIALRSDLAALPPAVPRPPVGGPPLPPDAAGRAATLPVLFPATFDVWVRTKAGFEVAFLGGAGFSTLRSPKYYLRTDDHATADATDDTKTVEEDLDARDSFRPDVMAVANLRFPDRFKGIGLAFGVGLNNDSDPRYFVGPSLFLGRHFLVHLGWTGGRVDRLPTGQVLGRPPINGDSTLASLPTRFQSGFYVGIGFAFVPGAEGAFNGAFGTSQKTAKPAPTTPPPAPAPDAKVGATASNGSYRDAKRDLAATVVVKDDDLEITITPPGEKKTLKRTDVSTFAGPDKLTCDLSAGTLECSKDGVAIFKGAKVGA
jgi:hypothetical protein